MYQYRHKSIRKAQCRGGVGAGWLAGVLKLKVECLPVMIVEPQIIKKTDLEATFILASNYGPEFVFIVECGDVLMDNVPFFYRRPSICQKGGMACGGIHRTYSKYSIS